MEYVEVEPASEVAVSSLLGDPVVVAWWLRDHKEADGFFGVIPKLMAHTRRDGHALPGQHKNPFTIGFHHGLPRQDEKELLGVLVEVTHLGGAGRDALLNHAQVQLLQ